MKDAIVLKVSNVVDLLIRPMDNSSGSWVTFRVKTKDSVLYSDPVAWNTSLELSENGEFRKFTCDKQIKAVMEAAEKTFRGFQSDKFVDETMYREIAKLLSIRETLQIDYVNGKRTVHKLHQFVLESMISFIPEWSEFGTKPIIGGGRHFKRHPKFKTGEAFSEFIATTFEKYQDTLLSTVNLYGTTKKRQGARLYRAKPKMRATISQVFHSGMANAVPSPRDTREISGAKNALRFNSPEPQYITSSDPDYQMPEALKAFFTSARIAVVFLEHDALDKAWIMPAGREKFASVLTRMKSIHDLTPREGWDMVVKNSRSYPVIMQQSIETLDEIKEGFHCLKLIGMGGTKFICEVLDDPKDQLYDEQGNAIELLIDANSLSRKGALLMLSMMTEEKKVIDPLTEENAATWLKDNLPSKQVIKNKSGNRTYKGYSGIVDNFYRPGVRANEQCKGASIATDVRVDALFGLLPKSTPAMEEEFADYKETKKQLYDIYHELTM